MALELLSGKGRIVSGLPCIYHLQGGVIFYSEAVKEDGDSYIFSPEKTVAMFFSPPTPQGQQQFGCMKGFGPQIPLLPSFLRAGKGGCLVSDCTDPNIIKVCKQTLSGLVLTGKMPDGGTVQ